MQFIYNAQYYFLKSIFLKSPLNFLVSNIGENAKWLTSGGISEKHRGGVKPLSAI